MSKPYHIYLDLDVLNKDHILNLEAILGKKGSRNARGGGGVQVASTPVPVM
jgi:hypothetical protein